MCKGELYVYKGIFQVWLSYMYHVQLFTCDLAECRGIFPIANEES
jgi:hypothetical protein